MWWIPVLILFGGIALAWGSVKIIEHLMRNDDVSLEDAVQDVKQTVNDIQDWNKEDNTDQYHYYSSETLPFRRRA
ncbi:MAG: NDUFA4 family protein [Candidatus Yanofskybacteria bacterium]|nr:NDUFA4 family protein [Candidatus Yanofskybacteria bacterium]